MKTGLWLLCGSLAVAGCSSGAGEGFDNEAVGTQTEEIIRATSNGGRDQVVMLYWW
jgi:hypothetical protein